MRPDNKSTSEKFFFAVICILCYGLALLFVAHWIWFLGQDESFTALDVVQHALANATELDGLDTGTFMIFAIGVSLIAAFLIIQYFYRKQFYRGKEEGSAGWNKNLSSYNKKYVDPNKLTCPKAAPSKNIILTNDVLLSLDANQPGVNNNILIIGGSGTGKSRFFVKPNILQRHSSYVVTDPSGELLDSTGQYMEDNGYDVRVFNLVEMEYSNHYNPFAYLRDENGVNTLVTLLITNTTPEGSSKGDPFWEKSETNLLMAIIFYLYYEIVPEDQNFGNVMRLLLLGQVQEGNENFESPLDKIFLELEERDPDSLAVNYYKIFKQAAGKTAKSILISCTTRLAAFNLHKVKELTNTDDINLSDIGDKNTIIYAVIPSADTTYNFLVSLMYSQLFESLYFHAENDPEHCPGKRLHNHVRFLLDEFANIGTIPDFDKKLATMRKYKISCSIILQSLAQIKNMYKDSWETIVGNCASFLYLGSPEQTTNEYVSKKLGKATILGSGYTRSQGSTGSVSTADNIKGRDLMTPDELSRIDNKECVLFIYGLAPFFGKKYDYVGHPSYPLTGDATGETYPYRDNFEERRKEKEDARLKAEAARIAELKDKAVEAVTRPEQQKNETDKEESPNEVFKNGEDATSASAAGNRQLDDANSVVTFLRALNADDDAIRSTLSNARGFLPYSDFDLENVSQEGWDSTIDGVLALCGG